MMIDLKPYFSRYEAVVKMVENVFEKVKAEYPDKVNCKIECSDCCFALFDLTLIEALYINHFFNQKFSGVEKLNLIDKANRADRKIYKLKRQAHKDFQDGAKEVEILTRMAKERMRCPLLNDANKCDLYDKRPITCRLYGIPTASAFMSHTCGLSGFEEGKTYPTVKMEVIYKQLYDISAELVADMNTKYVKMAEMLVPLSMALITEYTDEYMGISNEKEDDKGGE